jgi:hypothetical protein
MLSPSRFIGWKSSPVRVAGGRLVMETRPGLSQRSRRAENRCVPWLDVTLSPQQLFGWRRRLRESQVGSSEADGLQFVPAVVDVTSSASPARRQRNLPPCKAEPGAGAIEIEIDGVIIRVGRGADAKTLMTVLRALKASA